MENIEYKFNSENLDFDKEDISLFLEKASSSNSNWHKKMPQYANSDAKTYADHWKAFYNAVKTGKISEDHLDNEFSAHKGISMTGKRCPGILGILTKSYLVKSPVEILIHIENNAIQSLHCSDDKMVKVSTHSPHQYKHNNSDLFKNKQSVKFSFPLAIKSKSPYVFFNPTYHCQNDIEVLPGVIDDHHKNYMSLIVHCMVNTSQDNNIIIKPNQPIAYLWLPQKTKLKYNENLKDKRFMKYFNQPKNWFGKN
jgi:hypothetical protein